MNPEHRNAVDALRRGSGPFSLGSVDDVEYFVRGVAPDLLTYFARQVSPSEDAADCLSEVLLVLWRRRSALPLEHDQRRAWTFGIANHVLKAYRRTGARQFALADRLREEIRVTPQFAPHSDDTDATDALAGLRDAEREVITLVVWDGFTLEEVATILSIKPAAARARYSRARRRLRGLLSEPG